MIGSNYEVVSQERVLSGIVIDSKKQTPLAFSVVKSLPSKIATLTDSVGRFSIAPMSNDIVIEISATGYQKLVLAIDSLFANTETNNLKIPIKSLFLDFEEITIRAPEELPSKVLHKNLIASKSKNNKDQLDSYEYELYTKIQFDLNNISSRIENNKRVQKLNILLNYLDSTDEGVSYLPLILNETLSRFYFKKKPREKKEIITASRTTGI